uniref:Uncharacterized protein n=1 Tax=Knipowitschia caucasica TaxID=637954 RepID=A0AAV2M497_KNICA
MSTVGLTAQETSFPLKNPLLWSSCGDSMDSKSSWWSPHESLKAAYTDPKFHAFHKKSPPQSPSHERHKHSPGTQRLPKKSQPSYLSLSSTPEPSGTSSSEELPSLPSLPQHRNSSPPHTQGRGSKPLPPLPRDQDSVRSLDNDEYFCLDEKSRLLEDQVIKPVRSGHGRQSLRIRGKVNQGFCERPIPTAQPQHTGQPQLEIRHTSNHHQPLERHDSRHEPGQLCPRQTPDRPQKQIRRTKSGPAGSFSKPCLLNQSKRSTNRTEVPPPIPPRLRADDRDEPCFVNQSKRSTNRTEVPPKLPPRDPLCRGCSRTPSFKGLPPYKNREMPPTQSFAPDPKYVYRGLRRQNSEGSPCIVPVIENGHKVSNTHYFLMDGPPARAMGSHSPELDFHKNPPVDLV